MADHTALRVTTAQGLNIYPGSFVVTASNTDTGAARTYNVSGPTFTQGETVVLSGSALVLQLASDNLGSSFAIVTNGRVTFASHQPIASFSGHIAHDLCAELA